jgi:chaperonin GroEL
VTMMSRSAESKLFKAFDCTNKADAYQRGQSPDVIISEVNNLEGDMGYNVATGEFVDMYENGIIDPLKVTSSALKNAASVVSTLITTNHCIIQGG